MHKFSNSGGSWFDFGKQPYFKIYDDRKIMKTYWIEQNTYDKYYRIVYRSWYGRRVVVKYKERALWFDYQVVSNNLLEIYRKDRDRRAFMNQKWEEVKDKS